MKKNAMKISEVGLHPKARSNLSRLLTKELNTCQIDEGFIALGKEVGWGWNFAEAAYREKSSHLTKSNAWGILIHTIKKIFEPLEYDQRPTGALKSILNANQFMNLKNEIIDLIASIPRNYSVYIRLHGSAGKNWGNVKISNTMRLIQVPKTGKMLAFKKGWRDESIAAKILEKKNRNSAFSPGNVLLKIESIGFVDDNTNDSGIAEALSVAKSFFSLGKITELLDPTGGLSPWGPTKSDLFVVDETAKSKIVMKIKLPDDLATYIGKFGLTKREKKVGLFEIDHQMNSLKKIGQLLNSPIDDMNRAPIATAAAWSFDADVNPNETVSFIQNCIALEAILGDDKLKDGITKALADRCAYLLGPTAEERLKFRSSFEKLYDHRSKLVHGRKVKLGLDAEESLYFGRITLKYILRKELGNFEPVQMKKARKKQKTK